MLYISINIVYISININSKLTNIFFYDKRLFHKVIILSGLPRVVGPNQSFLGTTLRYLLKYF